MMKRILSATVASLLLTSCMMEVLTVHMDYISHGNLASTYVGTPDPRLETALVGQRLVVSWWIPLCYKNCTNFEIQIKMRYGNREEATAGISFSGRQGWYVYALTNDEYFDKQGIKTYYVQLYADGTLIDEWQHQLWVSLIEFPAEDAPEAGDLDFDDDETGFYNNDGDGEDTDTSNDDEVQILAPI